jgi:hypothetical protein
MEVIVGAPTYRQGTYVIDRFMLNQQAIQRESPSCELVLATNEADLAGEMEQLLDFYGLRGKVITYETVKPEHARSWVWNVACGREAIRQYMLSQNNAKYYMSVDTDMLYDPAVVEIMKTEIQGYDVVFSGYPYRYAGVGLTGGGCVMINRETLEKVAFRCAEFRNGDTMTEDSMFEIDSFRQGCRIRKGLFLSVSHYISENEVKHVSPQPVGTYRRIMTSAFIRYLFIQTSLIVRCNIPRRLWRAKWRISKKIRSYFG